MTLPRGFKAEAERTAVRLRVELGLERIQSFAFSACTFHIDGRHIIVTNPLRQPGRRASDVAHEIAHLFLKHDLTEIRVVAGIPFRTCRPDQEERQRPSEAPRQVRATSSRHTASRIGGVVSRNSRIRRKAGISIACCGRPG